MLQKKMKKKKLEEKGYELLYGEYMKHFRLKLATFLM